MLIKLRFYATIEDADYGQNIPSKLAFDQLDTSYTPFLYDNKVEENDIHLILLGFLGIFLQLDQRYLTN